MQCKLSLNEKLEWLHTLHKEILTLVPDDDIEMEVETFTECIHPIEHKISAKQPVAVVPTLHSVVLTDSIPTSTDTTVSGSDTTVTTTTDATMTTKAIPPSLPDTWATTDVTFTNVMPVTHHGSKVKLPRLSPRNSMETLSVGRLVKLNGELMT